MNNIIIYPPLKKQITMNTISIDVIDLKLFEYVKIVCTLYNTDNLPIDTRMYVLTGDDYNNWSNDDNYIVGYCKKKLQEETSS